MSSNKGSWWADYAEQLDTDQPNSDVRMLATGDVLTWERYINILDSAWEALDINPENEREHLDELEAYILMVVTTPEDPFDDLMEALC